MVNLPPDNQELPVYTLPATRREKVLKVKFALS
jgi:hypothetical protein